MYKMLIFLTIFTLFKEFCNMLFHFSEITILLNSFNCICDFFMIVFNKIVMLMNAVSYPFNKNV